MLFLQFNQVKKIFINKKGDFIQYALALPVVLGLVYGGVILFGVVNAKLTVSEAAWAAVREYAISQNSGETRQVAKGIVEAHLPIKSVSSVGQESNLSEGFVQGILFKEEDHYLLNSLGNLDLYVLDQKLKTQLDDYINKNVSLQVKEVTIDATLDHDLNTEGIILASDHENTNSDEVQMVSGVILESE
ncbi:TadE/TadG family type IV pilus assembly protein [Chengkuizengella sp. SCS-71B]|uniref:TadE/TadG family type IV pilus assembly protein n=1 Tax=Chengkuizengella sp. SCS-71B TaxID=3115290 RepID=UPI0032C23F0D